MRRRHATYAGSCTVALARWWRSGAACEARRAMQVQQQAASVSKALQPKLQITSGGLKTWLMMRHPLRNQLAAADDLDDQHEGKGGDSYEEYYEEVAEAEEEMPAEGGTARL